MVKDIYLENNGMNKQDSEVIEYYLNCNMVKWYSLISSVLCCFYYCQSQPSDLRKHRRKVL